MNARLTNASLMDASPAAADLRAVLALVAGSTIVLEPAPGPEPIFSDWERERRSADVDALILAWIASHVPGTAQRSRLH
jgi:hypothetical protein